MKANKWAMAMMLSAVAMPAMAADKTIEHGRYLVRISGCNDCHTPQYMQNDGTTPEARWLTGTVIGFNGPWGTTYPSNLRLVAMAMTEQQWLARSRGPLRPPMPSPSLRAMSDDDLKAIYHYIRSMGPAGDPAPAYVPPGQKVSTPYFEFVPKNLPKQAKAGN